MIRNVCEMLEFSAKKFSDKTAFSDPDRQISFLQLETDAKKIATHFLEGGMITDSDRSVVFYMEKCVNALPVMFGAVYCNAFYCFVDIRQSDERAADIIERVDPTVLVTDSKNEEKLKKITNGRRKYLMIEDLIAPEFLSKTIINSEVLTRERARFYDMQPLYVNFTSGSTGKPKGVVVGHASVVDFITEFVKTFDIIEEDVIANQAPFDFDVSVKDIYSGLLTGAHVCLIPREYFTRPADLMDYLCDRNVTVIIWAVTAMCFVSVMNGFGYRTPDKLRMVMFSGEIMPVKQLKKWREHIPNATYVNLYGPTEITCNCTYHVIDREYEDNESIPIGIPFANEKVFLLGDNDELITAPDTEGELCVAGTCLALGYYKDPQKTDEVFAQNPLNTAYYERIYRTGDLAKYDNDGLLHYTSRKDFQIKHMGQRIELSDIELTAMSIDGISRACCIYDHNRKKIILFYTGDAEKDAVSEALKEKLPDFMVPGKTVHIDEFPINKNGKIDRNALYDMIQ